MALDAGILVDVLFRILKVVPPPARLRELDGNWHSRYQREDERLGEWVTDQTRVEVRWPRTIVFTNHSNPVGSQWVARGKLQDNREIVGTWREVQRGATARGTFHLWLDAFGKKMYGLCSGPTHDHKSIYGGWLLAREREMLDTASDALCEALLVSGRRRPASSKRGHPT